MMNLESFWPLEKCLGDDGEELSRIRRTVAIDKPAVSALAIFDKLIEFRFQHTDPLVELVGCWQIRSTIADSTIHHVELVSKLMKNKIVSGSFHQAARFYISP